VKLDPGVLHADTLQSTRGFFNMSRLIFTRATPRAAGQSHSVLKNLFAAPFSSRGIGLHPNCAASSADASIFATAAMLWPPRTMRTAPA